MKQIMTMFEEISPKEQRIYDAVIRLMEYGNSLNSLKVSQIANEAGIGKGTTYEYFKSKDEIIGKAVLYDIYCKVIQVWNLVVGAEGFREKYMVITHWLENNLTNQRSFTQLIQLASQDGAEVSEAIRDAVSECPMQTKYFFDCIVALGQEGVKEGILSKKIPAPLIGTTLMHNIASFVYYTQHMEWMGELTIDELREFTYDSLVKALQ